MIYPNMTTYMQRLQQSAARRYYYFVVGSVKECEFEKLCSKFNFLYSTGMSRQSRHRRRVSGDAVTVLHAVHYDSKIHFSLMCTDGGGKVMERENLHDLRQKNSRLITPCCRYQLLHDGKSWSWSMRAEHFNKYRERIHLCAALLPHRRQIIDVVGEKRDRVCEKILDDLYFSEPGFRLVRLQIGELVRLLQCEWQRLRPRSGVQPTQRTFLKYVRFEKIHQPREEVDQAIRKNLLKQRAFVCGQTYEERLQLLAERREFRRKRNVFRAAIRTHFAAHINPRQV